MTTSPTPETDAAQFDSQPGNPMIPGGSFVVPIAVARKLERERDELQAKLDDISRFAERQRRWCFRRWIATPSDPAFKGRILLATSQAMKQIIRRLNAKR